MATPVLRWNIGPRTQATFEFQYKDSQDPVDYGIPTVGNRPANVSRRFNVNEPGNVNDSQSYLAGFNGSHGFNDDWTLRQSFYWVGTDMSNRSVAARYAGLDPATNDVSRYKAAASINSDTYFTTLNLTGKFATWGLGHTLLFGWDYYNIDQKNPVICSTRIISIVPQVLPAPTTAHRALSWDRCGWSFDMGINDGLGFATLYAKLCRPV